MWRDTVKTLSSKESYPAKNGLQNETVEHRYRTQPLFRVLKDVKQAELQVTTAFNNLKKPKEHTGLFCGKKPTDDAQGAKEEHDVGTGAGAHIDAQLETRLRYYRAVKVKVIHMHESGFLGAAPVVLLMEAVDTTIDNDLHDAAASINQVTGASSASISEEERSATVSYNTRLALME